MKHSAPDLALYYFPQCPFCIRVTDALRRLGVQVELRDIHQQRRYHDELMRATGDCQVPVLRIADDSGDRWMPESLDIIRYLEERFG